MKAESAPLELRALPALGDVLDFMRLIWQVDHALQRTSKRLEATLGVTGPQRLVIRIVGRFPGIPAGHLARLLHVHPSTLTGILKRLEQQGLMRKRVDPRDARRLLLSLTDAGRVFDVETEGTVEAAVQRALAATAPDKVAATRELLSTIAETLSTFEEASVGGPNVAPARVRKGR
jgi:MarR family transcriptional regulator, organic hydroperoxide resistance regulator